MVVAKTIKQKKCKACGIEFTPWSTTQKACNLTCSLELVDRAKAKKEKRELRKQKQKLKTLSDRKKEAQVAFNKWIRHRDRDLACISCGRYEYEIKHDPRGGKMDCGHFHSIGARSDLRFNEFNANKQCKHCNRDKSGNHGAYRLSLIDKIGLAEVEKLDGSHELIKWDKEWLIDLKKDYQARLRE